MNKLYVKLAATNIKNNKQFYLPYLLTGILSVAMFYLMMAMKENPGLDSLGSGTTDIRMILAMGVFVIGVFVSIFLFYTNSFIIKRRKKELGVYNILGMEKKHIAKVMFIETIFTMIVAIAGGLGFGIAFNKLLTMILYRLTAVDLNVPFYISGIGCRFTIELFVLIYGAAFLYNIMQVKLANPIQLLHSSNTGEREPKTKVLMSIIGVVSLGAGYYLALDTPNAFAAISNFFNAVLLVIIGTYCLFTAGSIALLKLLRKNKKFYYQTKHFTTVSGMIYRMKQNAVGLANICILSTMVLITVSTTVCMYIGVEDGINTRYPAEINISADYSSLPEQADVIEEIATTSLKESGRVITNEISYMNAYFAAVRNDNEITLRGMDADNGMDLSAVTAVYLTTKENYEAESGVQIGELSAGEIAVATTSSIKEDTVNFMGEEYAIKEKRSIDEDFNSEIVGMDVFYFIVADRAALEETIALIQDDLEAAGWMLRISHNWGIDIDGTSEQVEEATNTMIGRITDWENGSAEKEEGYLSTYIESRQANRMTFYRLYGALFFLGLFLGALFLMVTVLIIFYKQISEGYEDKERYAIMEKVGMSNQEVKRAIRSQVLMVFFLPLAMAIVHVCMAFPMIRMLLEALNLTNVPLFMACVAGTALVFGIIYLIVFFLTSRSYYKIVGNQV